MVTLLTFTLAVCSLWFASAGNPAVRSISQEPSPDPPADFTKIYYLSANNTLIALPFEAGTTSVNVFQPASEDRVTRVRVSGRRAEKVLTNENLHFFVFVADRMDPPPHQLVRLAGGKSERSLKISVIKGRRGYAPFDGDNIRLERIILKRLHVEAGPNRFLFINYMQLRPLQPLPAGEYAIIGNSLADMATFRIK
ncbi:MAG: hypothetical protein DMF72_06780 [Acidobacteria bacterium]|nr:MAG: hypothetical protein DMF72_06780 [Acidobacteriota bacterium]